jgi:acyl-CoA reductase-like NAD-dependent aldehyde dehydrogenase
MNFCTFFEREIYIFLPGAAIAEHMDVDKIAFTGSVEVGRLIQIGPHAVPVPVPLRLCPYVNRC